MSNVDLLDVLIAYFKSWRSYRTILRLLKIIHRVTRRLGVLRKHTKHIYPILSMSWLKRNFARLGLKRRRADPPMEDLETITKVNNYIGLGLL